MSSGIWICLPMCVRRGTETGRGPVGTPRGERTMNSPRALSEPPQGASSAAALPVEYRREARRAGAPGSPFLWLLSFGEAKESNLPPGNPRRIRPWVSAQASATATLPITTPSAPTTRSSRKPFSAEPPRNSATWPPLAATCSSALAAATSWTPPSPHATSALPAAAVPPSSLISEAQFLLAKMQKNA